MPLGLARMLSTMSIRQTAVIGYEGLLARRMREAGCRVISANWNFSDEAMDINRRFASEVLSAIEPDCIHCNNSAGPGFLSAARERGIPIVSHVRTTCFEGLEGVHRASAHLIAVSEFVKLRLVAAGLSDDRISVVYDGVDEGRFSPGLLSRSEMRRKFGLPETAFVALMIARPVQQKRHDLMLQSVAGLPGNFPRQGWSWSVITGTDVLSDLWADTLRTSVSRT